MTRRKLAGMAAYGFCAGLSGSPNDSRITDYLAGFIEKTRFEDIPADVRELGRKSILDGLGLALAGSRAETGELVRRYLLSNGFAGANGATVIGSSMKSAARFAAFANGIGIHADDYDDTQLAVAKDRVYGLLTHPTAPVLPAVLALAEVRSLSGKEMLTAYHAGVEAETKIAEAIAPRHYEDGFHSTGTCGVFGAAAASARLYGLNKAQVLYALGIAGGEAAGLRENFGTMTKPFHAGKAAENGVLAAELASIGWTAANDILEAPRGFFHAAGGGFDPAAIAGKLGNPWTFASPGVSIKPFPSGSLTHPGMTEMQRLIREHHITAAQVDNVDVGTNRNMPNALIHHQPTDHLQAKFSMEFSMASLLLFGKAGLNEYTDKVVNRPEVQDMIRRIHFGVNPVAEAAGYNKMTTLIDIHLKDGKTISGRADFGKGSPANPMTFEDVTEKFLDCAEYAQWPVSKARGIVETVRGLETLGDVRALAVLCSKS